MNILERHNKDGSISFRLEFRIGTERKYETVTGKTRKQVETYWHKRLAELTEERQQWVRPSKEPLAGYLRSWLERKRPDLRPSTFASYRERIELWIIPALGKIALCDLSPAAIQAFLDGMRSKLGPAAGHTQGKAPSFRSIAYTRQVFRGALQDALRLGTLAMNPVDRTRGPKQAPRRIEAFTLDELDRLLDRAASTRLPNLLKFAAFSGLRRGEVLALTWAGCDLAAGTVTVSRSRVAVNGKATLSEPKTAAGRRVVSLPRVALEGLQARRKEWLEDRMAAGPKWVGEDWIFTTKTGRPLDPDRLTRDYRRIRDAAGLPALPFHALRHTAVSVQIAAKVPLEIISKRVGHARVGLTSDTYGHLLEEANKDAAEAVDAFLSRQKLAGK